MRAQSHEERLKTRVFSYVSAFVQVRSAYSSFADFQPLLILIVSLGTFSTVFGHTLTASVAFPTLNFLSTDRDPYPL